MARLSLPASMGVLECPWGVDGSPVGVEDYPGLLPLFFAC